MAARFFVDENDLALGKLLRQRHADVVYPGHPDIVQVPRGALDDAWLPIVASLNLVVITRDQRIRYRPVEKSMWLQHRVRGLVLTGRGSQSTTDSLAVIDLHWSRIGELIESERHGPWMYALTNTGLRRIDL